MNDGRCCCFPGAASVVFFPAAWSCERSADEDFLKRPRETRLGRGGNALAASVDTFTHPPCLAAPLRPGKEGARAAGSSVLKTLQRLLFHPGTGRVDDAKKGGKSGGVRAPSQFFQGQSPWLHLLKGKGAASSCSSLFGRSPFAAKCS